MRELRLSGRAATAASVIVFGVAVSIAGCGGGGGTVSTPFASASAPANVSSAVPGSTCVKATGGVAYIPAGNVLQIVPFESTTQIADACAIAPLTLPRIGSAIAVSASGIGAVLEPTAGSAGSAVLGVGGLTNATQPFISQQSQPLLAGTQPVTSIILLPSGTIGLGVGPDTTQATAGFEGFNNVLGYAPAPTPIPSSTPTSVATPIPSAVPTALDTPVPNPSSVPYAAVGVSSPVPGQTSSLFNPAGRSAIALANDGSTMLVRGPQDLITFQIVSTTAGFEINYPASLAVPPVAGVGDSTTLGISNASLPSANGLIAFAPASASRAAIGGIQGDPSRVTIVGGMPNTITPAGSIEMPNGAIVQSLAYNPASNFVAVGTSAGLYVLTNVGGGTPTLVATGSNASPKLTLTAQNATPSIAITDVESVGFSPDGKYLAALLPVPSTNMDELAVYAIDGNGNLSVPQVIIPSIVPPHADNMVVR